MKGSQCCCGTEPPWVGSGFLKISGAKFGSGCTCNIFKLDLSLTTKAPNKDCKKAKIVDVQLPSIFVRNVVIVTGAILVDPKVRHKARLRLCNTGVMNNGSYFYISIFGLIR